MLINISGANTPQLQTNHNGANTAIWSTTRKNERNLTKILDDGKNVPFKFDEVDYFSGGG